MNSSLTHRASRDVREATIIVVAIVGIPQLRRTLATITSQAIECNCEVIVAADYRLGSLKEIASEFDDVLFLSDLDCTNPMTLTTLALRRAKGDRVALTEDSCTPEPNWLRNLLATPARGRGAVGGAVEPTEGISPSMWAFAYVDFFRYMRPLREGPSPSLSVCNVAYQSEQLWAIEDSWLGGFHETNVHAELTKRFGPLWLNPAAVVRVRRNVSLRAAIYERYAFGRLFGATRIAGATAKRRSAYAIASSALPVLLTARMATKAVSDRGIGREFYRSFPVTIALVMAWSWGECLGYVTRALPKRISTAPEVPAGRESGSGA